MKARAIIYSAAELAWIEAHKTQDRQQMHEQFQTKFGRDDVTLIQINGLCKRKGWFTGRTGCFPRGNIPANKGRKMPFNANSARTQFKKGGLPANTKYLGHERVSKDGYVEISIDDRNPHTGYERRYVLKHKYQWEQANGPIAEGMCLKCLSADKTNTDPSNWEVIPRAMLPRLNGRFGRGYDEAPAQVKPTIMAIAKLEHKSRTAKQDAPRRPRRRRNPSHPAEGESDV